MAGRHSEPSGRGIAAALRGAWRRELEPLELTASDLDPCVDNLVRYGAGALVWRRLRGTMLHDAPGFAPLRRAWQLERVRADLNRRFVERAILDMREAGLDVILLKGWSVASSYGEPALRPLGDIDLLVRARDGERARVRAMESSMHRPHVDLHTTLLDLTDRAVEDLFKQSRELALGTTMVRVLAPEDQLRHLCLHFVRHAGCRPLWLCDIAATLEALPCDFDWECCLHGKPVLTERVVATIGLAQSLLGARPAQTAREMPRMSPVPSWLIRTVLRSWGAAFDPRDFRPTRMALASLDPRVTLDALARRWPNPLEATVQRDAPLTGVWRPVVQLHEAFVRTGRFVARLATESRRPTRRASA